jgi:16S rRNA (uracil1498-N3)-methyltransferase
MHCLYFPDLGTSDTLLIEGDEARHAVKSKRLAAGDLLRVLDGRGTVAVARVTDTRGRLGLTIEQREVADHVRPAVHVMSATPKGPRVEELVEGLVQAGAASWSAMQTKLGVVDPRESKLSRLDRIAVESAKQAQRPWLMTLGDKVTFEQALRPEAGTAIVLADVSGGSYLRTGAPAVRLLVGPEGGFVPAELDAARAAGAKIVNFGPHVLRIETACAVAAGVILAVEHGAGLA